VIYLYALAEAETTTPPGPGIDGGPVRKIVEGRLAAFFTPDPPRGIEPGERALLEHEETVAALMDRGAVLPMHFGTTLAGEEALRHLLVARGEELSHSLELMRGRVEMGVRAIVAARSPGRRAATRVADQMDPTFRELAVAHERAVLAANGVLFTAAYLVDRDHVEEFRRRADLLDHKRPNVTLVCSGPWPPYSFTERSVAPGRRQRVPAPAR
jgi:hypothetical protein